MWKIWPDLSAILWDLSVQLQLFGCQNEWTFEWNLAAARHNGITGAKSSRTLNQMSKPPPQKKKLAHFRIVCLLLNLVVLQACLPIWRMTKKTGSPRRRSHQPGLDEWCSDHCSWTYSEKSLYVMVEFLIQSHFNKLEQHLPVASKSILRATVCCKSTDQSALESAMSRTASWRVTGKVLVRAWKT